MYMLKIINSNIYIRKDYILSNNHINHLIEFEFSHNDEEIRDWYISFMKALSLRLNINTIQFFFDEVTINITTLTIHFTIILLLGITRGVIITIITQVFFL